MVELAEALSLVPWVEAEVLAMQLILSLPSSHSKLEKKGNLNCFLCPVSEAIRKQNNSFMIYSSESSILCRLCLFSWNCVLCRPFIIFLDLICVFLLQLILILPIVIFFTEKRINTKCLGNKFDWTHNFFSI